MKKLILVVAIVATGLVSAKDGEKIKGSKENEKKEVAKSDVSDKDIPPPDDTTMQCYQYSIYIPCQDSYIDDTQCWGPGSGTATWHDAWDCIRRNGEMAVDFFCGTGY